MLQRSTLIRVAVYGGLIEPLPALSSGLAFGVLVDKFMEEFDDAEDLTGLTLYCPYNVCWGRQAQEDSSHDKGKG